ncbi:MAG: M13 family metallopeptidase [Lachnospiraceae bacterium]|nr:M13 family metallopeptidase [Lachnospiraceae bacterium]
MKERKPSLSRQTIRCTLALMLTGAIITGVLSGCGSLATSDPGFAKGDPWLDSDLLGSISESDEIRPQDNFAAAANKEWILTEGATLKRRSFDHIADIINDNKLELLNDDSLTGKEAEELKKFADLAMDWDYRASTGVEPVRPYIESIEAISSIDEYYEWLTDMEKNPLGIAPVEVKTAATRMRAFPDEMMVAYEATTLSLGDQSAYYHLLGDALEKKEMTDRKVSYILGRLGYAQNDIDRLLKENYSVEKKFAAIIAPEDTDEDAELKYTDSIDELLAAAGSYPLADYMKSRGFENIKHMVGYKSYLKKVSGVCTEENLDGLKSMLIVGFVLKLGSYLDRETYDTFFELSKSRTKAEMPDYKSEAEKDRDLLCESIRTSGLVAAMDKLYLEKFVDPESAQELTQLTKDTIDIYRTEIFPNESWMSEEGKRLCIDKLNAITLNVIYPDLSQVDYSTLNLVPKEEGGSYLEAYLESMRYLSRMKNQRAGRKYEVSEWFPYEPELSTTITNSVYVPMANSINIYAGILADPAYHKGMSREELMSGIGAVIGHEITHGFDNNGVLYDKTGIKNTWMPKADKQEFSDRAGKVSSYYTQLQPYKGSGFYIGSNVVGEAVADMGGLKAMLTLASKYPDFDYDKFFRHYAYLWAAQISPELEQYYFKNDEHPLCVFRVNVGVQQFDKFYETYNVQPGDGMFLEEKKRIAVW